MPPFVVGLTTNVGWLSVGKLKFTVNVPAEWKNTSNDPVTAPDPFA